MTTETSRDGAGSHSPAVRFESVLGVGRLFLALAGLLAVYVDPTEPAHFVPIIYALLGGYAVYAGGLLAVLRQASHLTNRQTRAIHLTDMAWMVLLTVFSEGPVSPLVLFFLFALLAAAYRWGFRETIATAFVGIAFLLAEVGVALYGYWQPDWLTALQADLNRTILRGVYFLLTGFLLGYLAEEQQRYREEMRILADAARRARLDIDLGAALGSIARIVLRAFDAEAVDLVLKDFETGRLVRCRLEASYATESPEAIPLPVSEEAAWLFRDEGRAWQMSSGSDGTARITVPDSWALRRAKIRLPQAFAVGRQWASVKACNMGVAGEWQARVFIWDAHPKVSREHALHFLEALLEHVTPAVTSVLLMRRLHLRTGAAERARVARELHDGAIQALFGIEMRVAALMRAEYDRARVLAELGEIQQMLRREVQAIREVMLALRPIELDSGDQLPDVLAAMVERFRRDSGLSARFVSVGRPTGLSAEAGVEIVRIVQEGLVNARKHSRARNVLVRLTCDDTQSRLLIEDDGVGFPFAGRFTAADLDARRLGPTIIKERAKMAGANFILVSTPGQGTSLELDIPTLTHA